MALVEAKCTNCGAKLEVDNAKEAAVCPACNSPFIVEKAINNITNNITNENNFTNSNVTIVNNESISLDDGVYDGETKSGKPHGYGVCQYSDGSKYEGNWLAGAKNGEGTIVYEDGSSWTGIWKNNEPWTGNGRVFAYRHCYYEGEYKNGEPNGNGALYYDNGKKWTGLFKNGNEWNGEGYIEFYNSFGKLYQTFEGKVADGEETEFGEWYCDGHFEEDGTVFDVTKGVLNYVLTSSETITIPNGIQSVNSTLVSDVKEIICPKTLTSFHVEESHQLKKLEKFVAPGIVNVSDKMFYDFQSLKEVKLDNAKEIGKDAFRDCCNLKTIYIPNVIKIARNAFMDCKKLSAINLPNITAISGSVFQDCHELEEANIPNVKTIGKQAFQDSGICTLNAPKVKEIKESAFASCDNLREINLPELEIVAENGFEGCENLRSIVLPKLKSVGESAFACEKLIHVDAPQLEILENSAFAYCRSLKKIVLPSAQSLGEFAFYSCDELTEVVCENATLVANEHGNYNQFIDSPKVKIIKLKEMPKPKKILKDFDSNQKPGGCYVATCVYGSYDCPQVWTLRRYRDNTLAATWYGRMFIHTYYAISPTIVKWFGDTQWFKNIWKTKLDKMVSNLRANGVEDTPYQDREWR